MNTTTPEDIAAALEALPAELKIDHLVGLVLYLRAQIAAPAKLTTYQLTLAGFDAATDETDHHIKWVNAPTLDAALAYTMGKGWTLQEAPEPLDRLRTKESGVDATVDLRTTYR